MQRVEKLPEDEDLWRQLWLAGALVEQYISDDGQYPKGYYIPLRPDLLQDRRPLPKEKFLHTGKWWRIGLLVEE